MSEEEFTKFFPNTRVQGKDFPVFMIQRSEVALARKERKTGSKHTDFEIQTDKAITIEDDLMRRDITINSIAIDILTGEIIDPFDGKQDLENKIIRKTSDAFIEDPLRAYRIARFASTLGFEVSDDTIITMSKMREELLDLSAERVFTEFRKALLSPHPSIFLEVLRKANILDVHFKEIHDLIGVEQPILYHPEGDAYTHTLEVLEKVAILTPNASQNEEEEITRFCALVHDFGKGATPREEWPRHIGHEERGVSLIHDFCSRIKTPTKFEKAGKLTSLLHMKAGNFEKLRPSTKVKLFESIHDSRSISFKGMETIARVDSKKTTLSFAKLADDVMQIGVDDEMKKKCTNEHGEINVEKLKEMLLNKRCHFLNGLSQDNADR